MPALNKSQAASRSRSTLSWVATRNRGSGHWAGLISFSVRLGALGGFLLAPAIAPAPVHAYTGTVSVSIDAQPGESYETLLRRAEAIARAATQRSFDRDILITDVSITIIAQTATATAPVLSLVTTRTQWRGQPDPRRWATYYSTSKRLLGLNSAPSAVPIAQPTVTTSTTSTSTPTAPRSTKPASTKPASTKPASKSPKPSSGSAATSGSSESTPSAPRPLIPKRIPTPVGK